MIDYDALNPLYVIWEDGSGRHAGSMRLMLTIRRCMVNEHFTDLLDGLAFKAHLFRKALGFVFPDTHREKLLHV